MCVRGSVCFVSECPTVEGSYVSKCPMEGSYVSKCPIEGNPVCQEGKYIEEPV